MFQANPCPADCPLCAPCSTLLEQELLDMVKNARPSCDCLSFETEVNLLCGEPTDCRCFCRLLQSGLAACPQLGEAVCGHGNRCGVVLVAATGPHVAGDRIQALWINLDARTVFLESCGALAVGQWRYGSEFTIAPAAPCPTPGPGVVLARGQSWPVHLAAPRVDGGGSLFLQGSYYFDCASDTAIGRATCGAGPIAVRQAIYVKP